MAPFIYCHSSRFLIAILQLLIASAASADVNIDWVNGYDQGLTESGRTSRPALIYFHAPWCSWCEVYERDTLGNARVVNAIRQYYVPVLVDYDARPDLLEKYSGFGLPFTVILSARGALLARLPGILTPADMLHTLHQFSAAEQEQRAFITETIAQPDALDAQAYDTYLNLWLEHLDGLYDPATGTFSGVLDSGAGLKRPAFLAWGFMLRHGLWRERVKRAAYTTTTNLYDPVHGGFFYFRDTHRSDRHVETAKLLDANAWMIRWLAEAGRKYGNADLVKASRHGFGYLQQTLWDAETGGFFQAQVASANYYMSDAETVAAPELDRIKRADSNAQAAIALMETGRLLGDAEMTRVASEAVSYVLKYLLQGKRLYHSTRNGSSGPAFNLPEDLFWLLAAIQTTQQADAFDCSSDDARIVYQLAGDWLRNAMQDQPGRHYSNKLLGIIAWTAANSDSPMVPRQAASWALSQVRIESTSRPDDLVFALMAWHQLLLDGQA